MGYKTSKQRYFDRVYDEAGVVDCACGCGGRLKSKDKYGRDKRYINGHNGRKFTDRKEHKRAWYHRHKKERADIMRTHKKKYRNAKKIRLIKLRGSECLHCGLRFDGENAAIFDFHHIDRSLRSFGLSASTMQNVSWDKIVKELEKCVLLCANCHRLEHFSKGG